MLVYGCIVFPSILPICSIVENIKKLNIYDKFRSFIEAVFVINCHNLLILIAPIAVNECASIKWF
jgi:hypothetical protein